MTPLLQRIWSHMGADSAVAAFIGAGFLAESDEVRDVIALGALVAAFAIIWTKVVRPGWMTATKYKNLPHKVANIEAKLDVLIEIVRPLAPDATGTEF